MSVFKRAVVSVIALLLFFVVVIFVLENQQTTSLTFLGWHSPQFPAALYFIGALLVGLVIGPVLGMMIYWRKRAVLKRSIRSN
ncbi:lipopolysaccharide assembly protein LapA domain-containing protein [Pseudomonas bubulae]|uniref:lipopolysaccharide assembly protein LapA domain-containing protein n=1 Tax=Pseudomonas bubulae TaxID=2316085 RepID=UPI001F22B202|nr:LapA family protein [Pseudomonas bubulae]MCF3191599.1 alkaline shock response membrane anchor protein AmaP [Pseudomonas bubulae]